MSLHLLFLGVILLAFEAVIPGFGIFGVGGLLCLAGSLYFFLGAGETAAAAVGIMLLLFAAVLYWLVRRGPKSFLGRHLTLHFRSTEAEGYTASGERKELLGKTGTAQTVLRPSGRALIGGQLVDVITDGEFYEPGTRIKVVAVTGGRTVVRKEA